MKYKISFILALFFFHLTCFSGIGSSTLYSNILDKTKLPSLSDSSSLEERKIDYRQLPEDIVHGIYDFLPREDLENLGKASKKHLISKGYFQYNKERIYLKKKRSSSENITSILKNYITFTNFKMHPNPRIHSIEIEGYEIDSHVLCFIKEYFPKIKSLTLNSSQKLKDEVLNILSSFPHLTHLVLKSDFNVFTNRGLEYIAKYPQLTHLVLRGFYNSFTYDGLESVAKCLQLTHLVLGGFHNRLSDRSLRALKALKGLTHLVLEGGNEFTDKSLSALKNLKGLTHLVLRGYNNFTDKSLSALKALKGLTHLELGGDNNFTDEGLSTLKALKGLTHLILMGVDNKFTDKSLSNLKVLKSLTHLVLMGVDNKFTDEGLWAFRAHLKDLKYLTLY
jgi:hypothetical protein